MDNDVLRQAPLFSALDDEAATALRASMAESKLRRGDVLFHEGDSGDKLYIVLDGKVKLGRTADDGVHVHHDLTQEELAQLVGASRETVNTALADFASRGWLRLEPRSVVIMDVERMSRRAR